VVRGDRTEQLELRWRVAREQILEKRHGAVGERRGHPREEPACDRVRRVRAQGQAERLRGGLLQGLGGRRAARFAHAEHDRRRRAKHVREHLAAVLEARVRGRLAELPRGAHAGEPRRVAAGLALNRRRHQRVRRADHLRRGARARVE
jgi:hypothetical protein